MITTTTPPLNIVKIVSNKKLTQEKNIIHPFIKVLFLVTAAILDGI
jgi:hypothetical protein